MTHGRTERRGSQLFFLAGQHADAPYEDGKDI